MTTENLKSNQTMSFVGNLDLSKPETELHFTDGRIVRVPTALLQQETFPQPLSGTPLTGEDAILVPLIEEQLQVAKRTVETGKVRLHKSVEAYDVMLNEPLAVNTWKVERVARHEVVADAPSVRQEGSTTIYPLLEERLIITKELILVEEIHVTRELSERQDTQTVTLRRENLTVERHL